MKVTQESYKYVEKIHQIPLVKVKTNRYTLYFLLPVMFVQVTYFSTDCRNNYRHNKLHHYEKVFFLVI